MPGSLNSVQAPWEGETSMAGQSMEIPYARGKPIGCYGDILYRI